MFALLQQVVPLLANLTLAAQAQNCTSGWFGENCDNKCRCSNGTCTSTGKCDSGKCASLFFGPGCQFLDGFALHQVLSTPAYIGDHDETTCNPNTTATSVIVLLDSVLSFVWFRIHVSTPITNPSFSTKINRTKECDQERRFTQGTFVDVACNNTMSGAFQIILDGPMVGNLCSIYISLGRDVALKQITRQSSDFQNNTDKGRSYRPVDGSYGREYDDGYCSQTSAEPMAAEWAVTYSRPTILLYVKIANRASYRNRLTGFSLEAVTVDGSDNFVYNDTSTVEEDKYTIIVRSLVPTNKIIIRTRRPAPGESSILTLCQVETFGESICPPEQFGLDCKETCGCGGSDVCSDVTGACSLGCPPEFFGSNCSSQCQLCRDGICAHVSGKCIQCSPGYRGDECNLDCISGFYGDDCNTSCSPHCIKPCDPVTGFCFCKDDFVGVRCTGSTTMVSWELYVILGLGTGLASSCVVLLCIHRRYARSNTEAEESESQ